MGIGDWGLGIGACGLGPITNLKYTIPNPQIIYELKIFKIKFKYYFS